jgi:hypothetical protein
MVKNIIYYYLLLFKIQKYANQTYFILGLDDNDNNEDINSTQIWQNLY